MKWVLLSTGNIPVDRKSKDRQILFRGTFDALSKGEVVALFPEGTSYTEPRIMQVKDGAAWAAMEYTKWVMENPGKASPLPITVVPAAIVYTNKSKYRSDVCICNFITLKQKLILCNRSSWSEESFYWFSCKLLIVRLVDLDDLSRWTLIRMNFFRVLKEPHEVLLSD